RSFTYIDDCLMGMDLLTNSTVVEPLNVGSSERVTINQLVDTVEEIAGIRLQRKYDLSAPKGVRGRSSDNSAIRTLLNWEPSISLATGLERTYRWIYDEIIGGTQGRITTFSEVVR